MKNRRYTAKEEKRDFLRKRAIRQPIGTNIRESIEKPTGKKSEPETAETTIYTEKKGSKRGANTARRKGVKKMELIAWIALCVVAFSIAKWIDKDMENRGK